MKWIDLPPVWTIAALVLAKSLPIDAGLAKAPTFGGIVLCVAAALIGASLVEFARVKTTVIPHQDPSALITSGIFRLSRNPIYLADLLILAGFSLIWGKFIGLVLVPVLGFVLITRFIAGEEARLHARFGPEYAAYCARTRRWI